MHERLKATGVAFNQNRIKTRANLDSRRHLDFPSAFPNGIYEASCSTQNSYRVSILCSLSGNIFSHFPRERIRCCRGSNPVRQGKTLRNLWDKHKALALHDPIIGECFAPIVWNYFKLVQTTFSLILRRSRDLALAFLLFHLLCFSISISFSVWLPGN